jgi:hypothetical protein
MLPYRFRFGGTRHVAIDDEGVTFSPSVRNMTLRKLRWSKGDIVAVSVQQASRNGRACEVTLFRRDGTVQRFRDAGASAAEVTTAFAVRGYPDSTGR